MKKIFLIIRREYLTRVRKRTFIISTILFPVLYLLIAPRLAGLDERANKHRQNEQWRDVLDDEAIDQRHEAVDEEQ